MNTYNPKQAQLIQHDFVLTERGKHVKAVLEKWELKRLETIEHRKRKKK